MYVLEMLSLFWGFRLTIWNVNLVIFVLTSSILGVLD